jgi:hypothetical protein
MQSPRQSGVGSSGTDVMRNRVREWIARGKYRDGGDLAEAFRAHRGPDDWPVSADGRAWEVDHVLELWAGGTDTPDNYLPLHPDVHAIKSEILTRFRRLYRDRARVDGEQVDGRAGVDAKFDRSEDGEAHRRAGVPVAPGAQARGATRVQSSSKAMLSKKARPSTILASRSLRNQA